MQKMPWSMVQPIEVVHMTMLWIALYSAEFVAAFILNAVPYSKTWHYTAIANVAVFCLLVRYLGQKQFVADIQEICIYDIFVQIIGLLSYRPGTANQFYVSLTQGIVVLKVLRIIWPYIEYQRQTNIPWPLIGVFGIIHRLRFRQTGKNPPPLNIGAMLLLIIAVAPISIVMAYTAAAMKNPIPFTSLGTLFFAIVITAKLIQFFEAREQEHRQTERDLGAAKGREQAKQEYIAELTAQKAEVERQAAELATINAELDRKNATLQALYEERAAMAQMLAARNDRLADATHDVKTGMVPMAFKVNDFINAAPDATQRAAAVWLQDEINATAASLAQIIHQAKRANPLPPLAPGQALPIRLLCEYFLNRFNPMALEYCIDLSCENKAGNQASLQANEEEFKRIIGNLIINAIKYGKEDGTVRLVFYPAPDHYHVVVWDNGPGIPNLHSQDRADNFINLIEEQEKLQYVRYQTDQGEPAPDSGNGIGLINVKRLCKEVGIRIGMRSLVGRGTCFHLIVPISSILAK